MTEPGDRPPRHVHLSDVDQLYIDAWNVIGTRPDGWWRDRDAAVLRLIRRLQVFARQTDVEVVAVIDGRPVGPLAEGDCAEVEVHYAPRRGPNAADDRIVELLAERLHDEVAGGVGVVTADRDLRDRAAATGAGFVRPSELLAVLDTLAHGEIEPHTPETP